MSVGLLSRQIFKNDKYSSSIKIISAFQRAVKISSQSQQFMGLRGNLLSCFMVLQLHLFELG